MEIKDYLKYYIGQKYRYRYVDWEDGHWSPWLELTASRLSRLDDASIDKIELALRRLEDMTEDEAAPVFQLERNRNPEKGGHDFDLWKAKYGWRITRFDLMEQHLMLSFRGELHWVVDVPKLNIQAVNNTPLIFHYLLQQGFDLFSLIDNGLAVDAKLITN